METPLSLNLRSRLVAAVSCLGRLRRSRRLPPSAPPRREGRSRCGLLPRMVELHQTGALRLDQILFGLADTVTTRRAL